MTNGSGLAGLGNGGLRQKLVTNSMCGYGGNNPFLFSDSVPDLSALNNENHNHNNGLSTNHSTPQKIPYSAGNNCSRYSNGYASQNSSFNAISQGMYGSPRRIFINSSFGSNYVVDEEGEEGEVELRRPRIFRNNSTDNGNELDRDWLYRKPQGPTDVRHSGKCRRHFFNILIDENFTVQPMLPTHNNITAVACNKLSNDLDYSAHDSGLDTPPSTHRPSSYRELPSHANSNANANSNKHQQQHQISPRDSTETSVSSSRGTMLNSPGGSFRAKQQLQKQLTQLSQTQALNGTRFSAQEQRILRIRNEEDRCASIKSNNRLNHNELYDPNQNRYYKNYQQSPSMTPQHTPQHQQKVINNSNANNNVTLTNGNNMMMMSASNGSAIFRERYQHPALAAIINEAQGMTFRGKLKLKNKEHSFKATHGR